MISGRFVGNFLIFRQRHFPLSHCGMLRFILFALYVSIVAWLQRAATCNFLALMYICLNEANKAIYVDE